MAFVPPSASRRFPESDFAKLESSEKVEEENLPTYIAENYYPVYIGEGFEAWVWHVFDCLALP